MSILKYMTHHVGRQPRQLPCRLAALAAILGTAACAASPWGFPVPTMIGDEQGVAMTGVIKARSEEEVRRRLAENLKCPDRLRFASLTTEPADNALGTKMLLYKAVMKCDDASHAASSATASQH